MAGAPPPERVAEAICALAFAKTAPAPRVTVGNLWQGLGGSLAYRFLPRRLLLWTVRKNCGSVNPRDVPHGTSAAHRRDGPAGEACPVNEIGRRSPAVTDLPTPSGRQHVRRDLQSPHTKTPVPIPRISTAPIT